MRKYLFSTLTAMVAGVAAIYAATAFRQSLTVTPLDIKDGLPPFSRPPEARQKTGLSVPEVIKALGDKVDDAIELQP